METSQRALMSVGSGHREVARSHSRIRRARRLGQWLPLVRALARLARRARAGRRARARPRGARPWLAAALEGGACGDLSYSKVRALTRVAMPETEERLLALGRAGTPEHVELIVRGWRRMDRKAEAHEATRRHRHRALHVYQDADGMVMIRGRLEPEVGAVVMKALTAAQRSPLSAPKSDGRSSGNASARLFSRECPTFRHCRAVHEEGFQIERQADGERCFQRPDGRVLPDVPAPAAVSANP